MIEFNYEPYEHNIVVTGMVGTGKTERARKILKLKSMQNIAYVIWDHGNKFSDLDGKIIRDLKELETCPRGKYIIQLKDKSSENFFKCCSIIDKRAKDGSFSNVVFVVDELHQHVSKNSKPPELISIVLSDRNFGVSGIYISTNAGNIPTFILENCTHIFSYKLNIESSVEWMESYIGHEAWLLLSPDMRKKYKDDNRVIKEHSFIYRDIRKDHPDIELKP